MSKRKSRHPTPPTRPGIAPRPPASAQHPAAALAALTPLEIALLVLLVVAGLLANLGPVGNNDIGFHLRLGQEIAASGPPTVDNHSFTAPGVPYPDHEWVAQLGLWGLFSAFGVPGLAVAQGVLIGISLGLVAYSVKGPAPLRAVAVLPVLLLGFDHSEIRPHLLGWIYIAALGILLERRRYAWILGLLLLWANTHASVLLGVGLAGLSCLEEAARTRNLRPLAWAAAIATVPLLNPYGLHVYTLFFQISDNADFVGEWQPYGAETWQFFLLVAMVIGAAVGILKSRLNAFDAFRLFVMATLSFQSSRTGVVMAIFLAPYFGRWYGAGIARWGRGARQAVLGLSAVVVVGLLAVRVRDGRALRLDLDAEHLPVAAVEFIHRHNLTGPMYNDYNFGGYLLWKAPELPVFMDGRIEVYQGNVLAQHLQVSRAALGWEEIADRYGIQFFLVRPERGITSALLENPAWDLVYFDYNAAIFVRADGFEGLKRLEVISPTGNRDKAAIDAGIAEMRYLLGENPAFFGGHKVLAFLLYKRGDMTGSAASLRRYLDLHPSGAELAETQELLTALRKRGMWTE